MTRNNVDLPQPDGPINEMNSPRRISRSMPLRAVVVAVSLVKTLSTPGSGRPDRSDRLSSFRRSRPTAQRDELQRADHHEERHAEHEATRIAAHSFSGPVMYCWLKLMIARPRPLGMPPGPRR
jgi:hypothetical protein